MLCISSDFLNHSNLGIPSPYIPTWILFFERLLQVFVSSSGRRRKEEEGGGGARRGWELAYVGGLLFEQYIQHVQSLRAVHVERCEYKVM